MPAVRADDSGSGVDWLVVITGFGWHGGHLLKMGIRKSRPN
jgi:hypothetical protein